MYIILVLGLHGLFTSHIPVEHRAHHQGFTHATLEITGLLDSPSALKTP
jgi:hypothetical protein